MIVNSQQLRRLQPPLTVALKQLCGKMVWQRSSSF
jgi:hypothetical protein